ncbi:hypothetical protein PT974_10937 [Cladobotryum mycophilum]|uniref:Uncharacterized protein n=1 Tax=Cladobotryum mycophilum TaxID=491253 RepID=A0ABR0SBA0_9HYPO
MHSQSTMFAPRGLESSVLDELMEEQSSPISQIRDENLILLDDETIASITSASSRRTKSIRTPSSPLSPWKASRISKTKRKSRKSRDNDFTIYNDHTAGVIKTPYRTYYGSNVPAMGDRSNGGKFFFTPLQFMRMGYQHFRQQFDGHEGALQELRRVIESDRVKLEEAVKGYYQWTHNEHPNDVCQWVQDKSYDRRWTPKQKEGFRAFVRQIGDKSRGACGAYVKGDEDTALALDAKIEPFIQSRLAKLGITNLLVTKERSFITTNFMCTYLFYPVQEDTPKIYREDFNEYDAEEIDQKWPEYWAEEEGPRRDE